MELVSEILPISRGFLTPFSVQSSRVVGRSSPSLAGDKLNRPLGCRRRRLLTLASCLAVVGGSLLTAGLRAPAARADVVSAMNTWHVDQLPQDQLDPQLASMALNGVTLAREDAPWDWVEPYAPNGQAHSYHWGSTDQWMAEAAQHHIAWLPMLGYSPLWAGADPDPVWHSGSPPADISQYAAFVRGFASRYGAGGTFWSQNPQLPYDPVHIYEIWNEENSYRYWNTGPDPSLYANLYVQARAAIRSEDPNAIVIVGGLTDGNGEADGFVRQMFADDPGLRGNVDGFGLHPYVVTPNDFESRVAAFRQTLDSLGAQSVPIDITELGWAYQGPLHEPGRASIFADLATALGNSNCGIRVLAPYDWMDPPSVPTDADFGLADANGLRPAGSAWFLGLHTAPTLPTTDLCVPASPAGSPPPPPPPPPRKPPPRPARPDIKQIRASLARQLPRTGVSAHTLLARGSYSVLVPRLMAGAPDDHLVLPAHADRPWHRHILQGRGPADPTQADTAGTSRPETRTHLKLTAHGSFAIKGSPTVTASATVTLNR